MPIYAGTEKIKELHIDGEKIVKAYMGEDLVYKESRPAVYGATWDGSSSTKLTRTDASALFADPSPAVGDGPGSSPFDDIYPWSGMVCVNQDGNVLVAIPKYWVKVSSNPFRVQISGEPIYGYQVSPAHRDRGDGKGERDVVYIGRYQCDGSYMSRSGQAPKLSTPLYTFRDNIHALGENYWQADYTLQLTWWFLYIVEFADWDGQATIGMGNSNGTTAINNGGTDYMTYHTGRAAGTDGHTAVQYRNIENLWGNAREWRDGIIFSDRYICTYNNPKNFTNDFYDTGYVIRSNMRPTETGAIKAWGHDAVDPSFIFPSEIGGSTSTYVPDYYHYGPGFMGLTVCGRFGNDTSAGPFYLASVNGPGQQGSNNLGSRIQKLP